SEAFAEPEKIVRLVVESKKASADTADTATESDGVAAFLFKLEVDVEVGVGRVRLNFSIFVFYFLKVTELIQPQETEVPQRCVEDLTFLNENLPTDDLVASRSVPGECNAMNCELSVLININGNVYQLFLFIKILDGYRSEIDIAPRSVEFFKIVKAGAQLR